MRAALEWSNAGRCRDGQRLCSTRARRSPDAQHRLDEGADYGRQIAGVRASLHDGHHTSRLGHPHEPPTIIIALPPHANPSNRRGSLWSSRPRRRHTRRHGGHPLPHLSGMLGRAHSSGRWPGRAKTSSSRQRGHRTSGPLLSSMTPPDGSTAPSECIRAALTSALTHPPPGRRTSSSAHALPGGISEGDA